VPLWPQLRDVLSAYLSPERPGTELLFPSATGGMLRDVRGSMRRAAKIARIEQHLTCYTFRHTYAATRLQTTDNGQPVSPYTVMRELGHRDLTLIETTYGHLQGVRSRLDEVRYEESRMLQWPAIQEESG